MARKAIITINPVQLDLPAGSPAYHSPATPVSRTPVRHLGAELLMYPEPFRSIAEGRVGTGAGKKK